MMLEPWTAVVITSFRLVYAVADTISWCCR
jgi:hypothetical protein